MLEGHLEGTLNRKVPVLTTWSQNSGTTDVPQSAHRRGGIASRVKGALGRIRQVWPVVSKQPIAVHVNAGVHGPRSARLEGSGSGDLPVAGDGPEDSKPCVVLAVHVWQFPDVGQGQAVLAMERREPAVAFLAERILGKAPAGYRAGGLEYL